MNMIIGIKVARNIVILVQFTKGLIFIKFSRMIPQRTRVEFIGAVY